MCCCLSPLVMHSTVHATCTDVIQLEQVHMCTLSLCVVNSLQAVRSDVANLCPLLADTDIRCRPYSQPLNSTFNDVNLLLFALQIASAMDHLVQRSVRHMYIRSLGEWCLLQLVYVRTIIYGQGVHATCIAKR